MATLTQNTIEGTLVFVTVQTPQTKYQSTEKEFKVGIVVDEDTADSWNERFPKQTAKVVKTSDFKETYKIDPVFPDEKKQYVITIKKPASYKDGKELATQAYSYGYPAGSSIAAQSPDYQVAPKDITGYTLVTSDSPVSSLNGKQLTTSKAVPFLDDDQTVYYVYTKNAPTITTEKKTVNETVSYVDQNGQVLATKHTASVDFTRQVSTDAVTGEKTYGNWSAAQSFDAVKSPELKGYTADKAQIDKQTVNGDSKDLEFTVTYRSNDKPVITAPNQDYKVGDSIDPLKNVTTSDKEDGTTKVTVAKIVDQDGKVIDSIPNDKAGKYTVTYTTTDADGNTVTKDATISVRSNEKPGNGTDNGNPSSNQPGNPSQPSNATNNGVINTSTNIGSKVNNGAVNSPELPQTGENNRQSQTMSFIGVLLAMFGSLLGFLGIKKRRND